MSPVSATAAAANTSSAAIVRTRFQAFQGSSKFTELYGLVVRDTQIRTLLGEHRPSRRVIRRQAEAGVRAFCALHSVP